MNKVSLKIIGSLLALSLFGCASSGAHNTPKVKTTQQFQFNSVNFKFDQLATPKIVYHTPDELKKLLNDKIKSLLEDKGLLSNQGTMNKLNIIASYQRRFVGDETPFPSDALGYPHYSYKIEILDGDQKITAIEESNLTYSGGIGMNIQVMAMTLRDKKYEKDFVDAFANTIVERIVELQNN